MTTDKPLSEAMMVCFTEAYIWYMVYGVSGLEGFGRYPVFTVVFTGKYCPGKNRFWTLKEGKTGKNTTSLLKQFHISIIRLNMTFKCIIQDIRFLSMDNYVQLNIVLQCIIIYCLQFLYII